MSESRDVGSELHVRDVMTAAEFNNVVIYSVDMSHLLTSLTTKAEPNRPSAIMPATRQLPGGNINTPTYDSQVNMGNWVPAVKEIFTATKAIFIQIRWKCTPSIPAAASIPSCRSAAWTRPSPTLAKNFTASIC